MRSRIERRSHDRARDDQTTKQPCSVHCDPSTDRLRHPAATLVVESTAVWRQRIVAPPANCQRPHRSHILRDRGQNHLDKSCQNEPIPPTRLTPKIGRSFGRYWVKAAVRAVTSSASIAALVPGVPRRSLCRPQLPLQRHSSRRRLWPKPLYLPWKLEARLQLRRLLAVRLQPPEC